MKIIIISVFSFTILTGCAVNGSSPTESECIANSIFSKTCNTLSTEKERNECFNLKTNCLLSEGEVLDKKIDNSLK